MPQGCEPGKFFSVAFRSRRDVDASRCAGNTTRAGSSSRFAATSALKKLIPVRFRNAARFECILQANLQKWPHWHSPVSKLGLEIER